MLVFILYNYFISTAKPKQSIGENVNKCKNKSQCINTDEREESIVKSKFLSTLKPSSFLIEYPHAVAALINDEKKNINKKDKEITKDIRNIGKTKNLVQTNLTEISQDNFIGPDNDASKSIIDIPTTPSFIKRDINNTVVIPRRKHNYKYELIKD